LPLKNRAIQPLKNFAAPVSYLADEARSDRLRDSRNCYSNGRRLESRFGKSRYNATAGVGALISGSFFKKADGTRYILGKIGGSIYTFPTTGAPTSIKSGLTSTTKHRSKTCNNRHIISCSDGVFFFDGTNFAALGQAVPGAAGIAAAAGGSLAVKTYTVCLTFYSTTTGFETNAGTDSAQQGTSGGDLSLALTAMPTTATNPTIDKKRVYLKNVTDAGNYLFIAEIPLTDAAYTITAPSTSTISPPTTHGTPSAGGWKYVTEFNAQVVLLNNGSFPNDVEFSEAYLPDAWNQVTATRKALHISGDGEITGGAVGFFNNSKLDPFLVIFKRSNCHIYSEIDGQERLDEISGHIGCVSNETIRVINGSIYFLSENGWRIITNGKLVSRKAKGSPDPMAITLGEGDIDDIFRSPGYIYEVNKGQFENFFSVYYQTIEQYFTFVAEGSSTNFLKAYVYEIEQGGFKPYEFGISMTCGFEAEDSAGDKIVLFGDANGFFYKHSIKETRSTDVNAAGVAISVPVFAHHFWMDGDDYDCSFNFRELIMRAIKSSNAITVKGWTDFDFSRLSQDTLDFENTGGFILDESELDMDVFTDERDLAQARMDVNRAGRNLLLGFYQDVAGGNIALISAQLNFSKNGNSNV
jgi:hypothetical protein